MNNQINSENNTLQNSFDLQKTEVSRKAWTEPKIEDLDINSGKIPSIYEFGIYRFSASTPV
jgi:hypothetical protein